MTYCSIVPISWHLTIELNPMFAAAGLYVVHMYVYIVEILLSLSKCRYYIVLICDALLHRRATPSIEVTCMCPLKTRSGMDTKP